MQKVVADRTQRAYTMRLDGPEGVPWRDALWNTHEFVNRGVKVLGDMLLTFRGGLAHELAAQISRPAKANDSGAPSREEIRDRRTLLALCWLTVESQDGAPTKYIVKSNFDTRLGRKSWATCEALEAILRKRHVPSNEIKEWLSDCRDSLSASIRDDAVWVNRSEAFDTLVEKLCGSLTRSDALNVVSFFFGDPSKFLQVTARSTDEAETQSDSKASELSNYAQKAVNFLSRNWGTGPKSDKDAITAALSTLSRLDLTNCIGKSGEFLLERFANELGASLDDSGNRYQTVCRAVGWGSGRDTKGKVALKRKSGLTSITAQDIEELQKKLGEEAESGGTVRVPVIGGKALQELIESEIGAGYTGSTRQLTYEFAVMLDHAARKVSVAHSWIKLAEAERRHFLKDAAAMESVPDNVRLFLNEFCEQRSEVSGSIGGYHVRPRAITGWEKVVEAWSLPGCQTEEARVLAVRALQDDPEIEKFGDGQLFEALASDDARIVWMDGDKPTVDFLKKYVAADCAGVNRRRFKVPAYRHPNPFTHPVFCDFGDSRWSVKFSALERVTKLDEQRRRLENVRKDVEKAATRLKGATDNPARELAKRKFEEVQEKCRKLEEEVAWLEDPRGLTLGLWGGSEVVNLPLRWRSKRFATEIVLPSLIASRGEDEAAAVSRADRLGLAASKVVRGKPVTVSAVFEEKKWNARLQASREQLDAIGTAMSNSKLTKEEKERKVIALKQRIDWFVTFSPSLQPQGPWIDYANKRGLVTHSRQLQGWRHPETKGRGGLAAPVLARLEGIRVLSVDLGHRKAASCAVLEAVTRQEVEEACKLAMKNSPKDSDLWCICERDNKRVLYRRIGPNKLPDGSKHPAPWARVERQFTIKLQGEDSEPRCASRQEENSFKNLLADLGRSSFVPDGRGVDVLMWESVQTLRLALRRHSDRARIAFLLTSTFEYVPGGMKKSVSPERRTELLASALALWHGLAHGSGWTDDGAKRLWREHIVPRFRFAGIDEEGLNGEAGRTKGALRALASRLVPLAEKLDEATRQDLHNLWKQRWMCDDAKLRNHLRWLRDWLLPRKLKSELSTLRNVGGLSVERLATIRLLYQVQKAFFTRLTPAGRQLKTSTEESDTASDFLTAGEGFGKSILNQLERMRENRVKQLASRITAAALGLGKELAPQYLPCHVVAVENLEFYRPDDLRTRRENRQVMDWSAQKLGDYLGDSCNLNGLLLKQVPAAYTSRQDSRTGAPGLRCSDVDVKSFLSETGFWAKEVARARQRVQEKRADHRDRFLIDLHDLVSKEDRGTGTHSRKMVRVPVRGGELFVSADPQSPSARGLQADLNAAVNIGLRALIDPDWPGRWWYIPCEAGTLEPVRERVKGCPVFNDVGPLRCLSNESANASRKSTYVNLWRDPTIEPVSTSKWSNTKDYFNEVTRRVTDILRQQQGLSTSS